MEGQVKAKIYERIDEITQKQGPLDVSAHQTDQDKTGRMFHSVRELTGFLSLKPVRTPATGNCQVYAICQALTSSALDGDKIPLLEDLAAKKEGCLVRALIDFTEQFQTGGDHSYVNMGK